MPTSEFNSFMKELLAGTQKGKRELSKLAGEIKRDIAADNYDKSEYEKKKNSSDFKEWLTGVKMYIDEKGNSEDLPAQKTYDGYREAMKRILG